MSLEMVPDFSTDLRGQQAVLDLLRRQGLNPVVREDVNPYSAYAGGWTARVSIAVPADEAAEAAALLAEWEAGNAANVERLGRNAWGCFAKIAAIVIIVFLLGWFDAPPWLIGVVLLVVVLIVVWTVRWAPSDAEPPGDGWGDGRKSPRRDEPDA